MRSVNNVDVTFVFDRNEGFPTLARALWLRSSQNLGCVILVNRIEGSLGRLVITGTVLAIRNAHPDIKKRLYDIGLYTAGLVDAFCDD